jgi:hypothetical protein
MQAAIADIKTCYASIFKYRHQWHEIFTFMLKFLRKPLKTTFGYFHEDLYQVKAANFDCFKKDTFFRNTLNFYKQFLI